MFSYSCLCSDTCKEGFVSKSVFNITTETKIREAKLRLPFGGSGNKCPYKR